MVSCDEIDEWSPRLIERATAYSLRTFVRNTHMKERALGLKDDVGFMLPTRRSQYVAIRRTMRPFALDRWVADGCIDVRYPYLDKRLVEFALAIPLEQKVRLSDGSRSVVRRALRNIVPDTVRLRVSKNGPVEALYRAIARERSRLLGPCDDLRLGVEGIVRPERFAQGVRHASQAPAQRLGDSPGSCSPLGKGFQRARSPESFESAGTPWICGVHGTKRKDVRRWSGITLVAGENEGA
jgi:hypothetical protein